MQCEGNRAALSLEQVGQAYRLAAVLYQHYTGAFNMKVSLSALHTACALTVSAFDIPPIMPPHAPVTAA
jgi:hypothetical protein